MRIKAASLILTILQLKCFAEGKDTEEAIKDVSKNTTRRILFGGPANPADFPFLVTLTAGGGYCGGSIIADQWVMSAAHCIYGHACNGVEVKPVVWGPGRSARAVQCFVHPQYQTGRYAYDISLIRVDTSFLQDGLTKPIPLPEPGAYFPAGTPAVIAGYGRTQDNVIPGDLLRADVLVEDWGVCDAKFKDNDVECRANPACTPTGIPNRIICTQGIGGMPPGTCFGDSGGPVIINGWVSGISSFVQLMRENGFCKYAAPSMHVSVADYLPWILSIVTPDVDTSGIQVRPEN